MLTDEDIKRIIEYQREVFKDVFFSKNDGNKLQSDVTVLQEDVKIIKKDVSTLHIDIFTVKEDVSEMKGAMQNLEAKIDRVQNTIDAVLKDKLTKDEEVSGLDYRMERAEGWIDKASPKLGLKFER